MTITKPNRTKSLILAGAMSAAALVGGGAAMALFQPASAQTTSTTTVDSSGSTATAPATGTPPPRDARPDPSKGGHVGANGVKEELLTGDRADKVTAAALAAVPGGTVERVENDAEGATYEAHVTKADGSDVTVKLDANFTVNSTESGHR